MWEDLTKEFDNMSTKTIRMKYPFLGEGIARKVYALDDDNVIKISKGIDGIHQNSVENYIYTNCSQDIKSILCPIEYFNKKYIIMKRALPMSLYTRNRYVDVSNLNGYRHLKNIIYSLVKEFHLLEEDLFSATSWGFINDNLFLIDYGCTSNFGDLYYDFIFSFNKLN